MDTLSRYDTVVAQAKRIFSRECDENGPSWRILRPLSILDKLFTKATKIRVIISKGKQKIGAEFLCIINNAAIAHVQFIFPNETVPIQLDVTPEEALLLYKLSLESARENMKEKIIPHFEAFKAIDMDTCNDLIFQNIERLKRIVAAGKEKLHVEGFETNIIEIMNYAILALMTIEDEKK